MTILCIGKSGQVAQALAERARSRSVDLIALGRPELDLLDLQTVETAIAGAAPRFVINAAAYTNVDGAESDEIAAFALNADAPTRLASICARLDIPLLHISTDYVFDGTARAPYLEDAPTGPLNVYGRSKLAGEIGIRGAADRHIILRTSWVYGPHKPNFITTMLRLAAEQGGASVVDDQIGAPTSALDIADVILDIVTAIGEQPDPSRWGTYHFASAGSCSWADFAQEIFDRLDGDKTRKTKLRRIPTSAFPTPAMRPQYSVLSTQKLTETFAITPRDWTISVQATLTRLLDKGIQ